MLIHNVKNTIPCHIIHIKHLRSILCALPFALAQTAKKRDSEENLKGSAVLWGNVNKQWHISTLLQMSRAPITTGSGDTTFVIYCGIIPET